MEDSERGAETGNGEGARGRGKGRNVLRSLSVLSGVERGRAYSSPSASSSFVANAASQVTVANAWNHRSDALSSLMAVLGVGGAIAGAVAIAIRCNVWDMPLSPKCTRAMAARRNEGSA